MKTRLSSIFILFLLIFSCNKNVEIVPPSVPTIETITISELTYNSAISGGIITDYTGPDVLVKGVCWSISSKPKFDDDVSFHTLDGVGNEEFTSLIEQLDPETTYYIRAFAKNEIGVGYGNQFTFTTNPLPDMLCPEAIEVACIEQVPTAYTTYAEYAEAGGTINDAVGIDSESFALESSTSDDESCPKTITRIYTIDNVEGITYTCSQEVIINDTTAPTASSPSPITIGCAEDIPEADIAVVTVMGDNCTATEDLVVAFVSDVSGDGECPRIITRTYSVTDVCGNSINVTQTINVNSESAPNMDCPPAITVQCVASIPDSYTTLDEYVAAGGSASDADGIDVDSFGLVSSINNDETCPMIITRTYTVSDVAGNTATCSQDIIVNDTIAPTASNPPNIEAYCSEGAPLPDITVVTVMADNCTASEDLVVAFVEDISDGGDCPEIITRTYSVTDECNNSIPVQQTISLNSNEAPNMGCPLAITVQCVADVPAGYTSFSEFELAGGSATDADGIDEGSFDLVSSTSDGETCPETITRIYEVSDNTGTAATCSQIIEIDDTTYPTASNPPDIEISCSDSAPDPDTSVVTDEEDNCSTPTVSHVSDESDGGACATITRIYSVTDGCNSIEVTQTITFTNTPPSMTCPLEETVECHLVPALFTSFDEFVAAGGGAIDTDDGIDEGSFVFVSSSTIGSSCDGTITRTYGLCDNSGNCTTCSQIIVIHDTTNPTASDPLGYASATPGVPPVDLEQVTDEADNCTTSPTVGWVSDSEEIVGGMVILTRTYSVTDECGNSINVTQEIQLAHEDHEPPEMECPTTIYAECDAVPAAYETFDEFVDAGGSATDADGIDEGSFNLVSSTSDGGTCPETITRTYQISDNAGNTSSCSQEIKINDTTPPTADPLDDWNVGCLEIYLGANISVITGEADNCTAADDLIIVHEGDFSETTGCPRTVYRTYSITDSCDNTTNITRTIYIEEEEEEEGPPTVITGGILYGAPDDIPLTATVQGNVTSDGGSTVIERGICWIHGSSGVPTDGDFIVECDSGTGLFYGEITAAHVAHPTSKRVRAYAKNMYGVAYGETKTVHFTPAE